MVSSSSWETRPVLAWRRRAFGRWSGAPETSAQGIPTIHLHSPPGDERRAFLMQREASETRSITMAEFHWADGTCTLRHWPIAGGCLLGESPRRMMRLA